MRRSVRGCLCARGFRPRVLVCPRVSAMRRRVRGCTCARGCRPVADMPAGARASAGGGALRGAAVPENSVG